jgi:hypothetical protein
MGQSYPKRIERAAWAGCGTRLGFAGDSMKKTRKNNLIVSGRLLKQEEGLI